LKARKAGNILTVRADQRRFDQLRPVKITRDYLKYPEGSVLIECGDTKVICTAIVEDSVPFHKKGTGSGWITAEYSMIPGSTADRVKRETHTKVKGRSLEIQRLVGRALRAIVDMDAMGEISVMIDADVIQADGGTRTASITGSFVAMHDAFTKLVKEGRVQKNPIREFLAATSVGVVGGVTLLDLNYGEDSQADVDMNIVMTESGRFVELQGTAEKEPFNKKSMDEMLVLGSKGIKELIEFQKKIILGGK
jgi:ribonuclease PH